MKKETHQETHYVRIFVCVLIYLLTSHSISLSLSLRVAAGDHELGSVCCQQEGRSGEWVSGVWLIDWLVCWLGEMNMKNDENMHTRACTRATPQSTTTKENHFTSEYPK
jgi:hypothetical protein